ncbi:MAG: hypothetical protein NT121_23880 [Chloroflexi bacterium]|nr:hypothetical protein [Chloroflexota bacterium]
MTRLFIQRFLILIALGIAIAIVINEFTFIFMKSDSGRGPERFELVIPAGTSDRIAKGEPNPAIPANMVFHRLGPLFIPVGTSASLTLSDANNYAYTCSFQPSQVFGLDVQEPVTSATRLYGILFAGIPLGMMFAIYSLVIWPIKRAEAVAK